MFSFWSSKSSSNVVTPSACNITEPGHVPLDVQAYPLAPPELELQQVHVYVRHGERTPVKARMTDHIPSYWNLCHVARHFQVAVAGPGVREMMEVKRVVEIQDGSSDTAACTHAELTDFGRQSTHNFGAALRSLYVDKLAFLPDIMHDTDQVYLRSSNRHRTIESLQQVIHGLFPPPKQGSDFVPHICVRNKKDENLYPNTSVCKRLDDLMREFAQAAAESMNPTLEQLDSKLSKYIDGKPVRVDGSPRASGILETIRAATANGVSVPSEFRDPKIMDTIEKAVVVEWFSDAKSPEVRRLGVGRLLDDISEKMKRKAVKREEDPLKILVNCTHDTAISGVLETLEVFDQKWPAFTASMSFELFEDVRQQERNNSSLGGSYLSKITSSFTKPKLPTNYYVRMRYQNKTMILPACKADGNHLDGHLEFCTLAAFSEKVKELTPVNWEKECAPKS